MRLFLMISFLVLLHCKDQDFHVRGVKVTTTPHKKLMVGTIGARDYKTPKSIAKDFRDLFAFELIQKGYSLVPNNPKLLDREIDSGNEKTSLPLSLRKSAGESSVVTSQFEKLLDKNEIKMVMNSDPADYFVQGVVSIQSNERILDREDYNYIFLNVYDADGNLLGMVNSSFDEKILAESDLLRKVAESVAMTFDKSMK